MSKRIEPETLAIRSAFPAFAARVLAGGRVDFPKLHQLVIFFSPHFRDKRALMVDVFRSGTLPVAAIAYLMHEAESLRSARKTANKRGRTLVLSATDLNSYAGYHVERFYHSRVSIVHCQASELRMKFLFHSHERAQGESLCLLPSERANPAPLTTWLSGVRQGLKAEERCFLAFADCAGSRSLQALPCAP